MQRGILGGTVAALLGAAFAGPACAQALPTWKIADICAAESAPGQCAAFEGRALRAVSASWPFVLDPIKKTCLEQAKSPPDQSWRLLAGCLDGETRKALDDIAVHTARTPAEPVPPPKPPAPPPAAAEAAPPAAAAAPTQAEPAPPAAAPPAPVAVPAPAPAPAATPQKQ
jgi:hypothetical protein